MALQDLRQSLVSDQIYRLSELLKRPVYAADKKIGWLEDFVIQDKDIVAETTHVCIGRPFGDPTVYAPWAKVRLVNHDRVTVEPSLEIAGLTEPPANPVLLADYILDKKVLDVEGREVEVVYDCILAIHRIHLFVIAVDLSKRSMWRRAGLGTLQVSFVGKAATLCLLYAFPLLFLGDHPGCGGTLARVLGWSFATWGTVLYWWAAILYLVQVKSLVSSRTSSLSYKARP